MLRVLLVLLVAANLAFYAWSRGWLTPVWPPRADPREPGRLAAQVRPELITVLSPNAASAAAATAVAAAASDGAARSEAETWVCLEAGPFTDSSVLAAEAALAQNSVPDGAVSREPLATAFSWGVVMGRFPDREAMRSKADELRRMGLKFDEISGPSPLAPGLRLGNYSDKFGAEAALRDLGQKGVRTARVVQLPVGPVQQWLRAARADSELQTRLKSLPGDRLGAGFRPCVQR